MLTGPRPLPILTPSPTSTPPGYPYTRGAGSLGRGSSPRPSVVYTRARTTRVDAARGFVPAPAVDPIPEATSRTDGARHTLGSSRQADSTCLLSIGLEAARTAKRTSGWRWGPGSGPGRRGEWPPRTPWTSYTAWMRRTTTARPTSSTTPATSSRGPRRTPTTPAKMIGAEIWTLTTAMGAKRSATLGATEGRRRTVRGTSGRPRRSGR